jgi:hypothetical protein
MAFLETPSSSLSLSGSVRSPDSLHGPEHESRRWPQT